MSEAFPDQPDSFDQFLITATEQDRQLAEISAKLNEFVREQCDFLIAAGEEPLWHPDMPEVGRHIADLTTAMMDMADPMTPDAELEEERIRLSEQITGAVHDEVGLHFALAQLRAFQQAGVNSQIMSDGKKRLQASLWVAGASQSWLAAVDTYLDGPGLDLTKPEDASFLSEAIGEWNELPANPLLNRINDILSEPGPAADADDARKRLATRLQLYILMDRAHRSAELDPTIASQIDNLQREGVITGSQTVALHDLLRNPPSASTPNLN